MLRNLAAILTTLSGLGQCLSLWFLPTDPALLLTAALGTLYLLLGLGLFGTSRFSLVLAIVLLPTRSLLHLYPLDIEAWEMLRVACDIAVAALCLPALWVAIRPDSRAQAAPTPGVHGSHAAVTKDRSADLRDDA